ncbi:AGAP007104-PA-like protein [Anopheles sinensis]|uniref:AGAP007104-PA-like protein n=1 Tax=Anopheles sinensis TaxID=74873 RepID=A0A084VZ53_ANOSI|nr:AGAP007104-PA-like protein [Anopheles sinensis]
MFAKLCQMEATSLLARRAAALPMVNLPALCSRFISKSSEVNNSDYMTIRTTDDQHHHQKVSRSYDSKQQIRLKKVSR